MYRVVFDTNNWISGLLKIAFKQRIDRIRQRLDVKVLISKELIEEIQRASQKDYLRKTITSDDVNILVEDLQKYGETVAVHSTVQICRDPKDNFLLALSQDGAADYLITGDDDLLALGVFGKTKIITLSEFEKE